MSSPKHFYKLHQKLIIIHEAYLVPLNIKNTARKYGVTPKTIQNWHADKEKIEKAADKSNVSLHSGPAIKGINHVSLVLTIGHSISYNDIVQELLSQDPLFLLHNKENDIEHELRVYNWVRRVVVQEGYTILKGTHVAQIP
jgi:hypothetical protein